MAMVKSGEVLAQVQATMSRKRKRSCEDLERNVRRRCDSGESGTCFDGPDQPRGPADDLSNPGFGEDPLLCGSDTESVHELKSVDYGLEVVAWDCNEQEKDDDPVEALNLDLVLANEAHRSSSFAPASLSAPVALDYRLPDLAAGSQIAEDLWEVESGGDWSSDSEALDPAMAPSTTPKSADGARSSTSAAPHQPWWSIFLQVGKTK